MPPTKPTGWHLCRLGDAFRIKHGYAFKGEFFRKSGSQIVLTPGNFNADGGLKLDGEQKYYAGDFPEEFVLQQEDLVVVMTDLKQNAPILGSPAFIPAAGKFLHNQRLGKIINLDETKIQKRFLYYLFNSRTVREQIKATATGATVRHTAPDRIYDVRASLPSIRTQEKVSSILSAYDDFIENNTRRIKILEEMARRIYEEWFVRFRFAGHGAAKMIKSKLGPVPAGWDIKKATDAIEVNPTTRIEAGAEHPYVAMSGLSENSMIVSVSEMRTTAGGSKFKNSDTLFARITPCLENGKTGYVQFLESPNAVGIGSTEFIVLRSGTLCPEFVYMLARTDSFRNNAIKSMSGASGRQRVQEACFEKFYFAHPSGDVIQEFQSAVRPMFQGIYALSRKNVNLRRTRDLLLTKLISGELDVSDLDIPTEAIA